MKKIIRIYKSFLKEFKLDKTKIIYNDDAGYPLEDAIFDALLLYNFPNYLKSTNNFKLWVDFNDDMDKDVLSKDYSKATEIWNALSDLTKSRVNREISA